MASREDMAAKEAVAPPPEPPAADEMRPEQPDDDEEEPEPAVPPGNPLRLRALPVLGAGVLLALGMMASRASPRLVVALGGLGVLLACFGLLDLLGTFDDPDERVARSVRLGQIATPLGELAVAATAGAALLRLAVAGVLPVWATAAGMPLAVLGALVALGRLGERLGPFAADETGARRPLWRRHGFWLLAIAVVLYVPMLGNHSLSDPWETHYGEVAREILARHDWISLWWAQDGWFWSKPVLSFWLQAVAMALFGVRYEPGAMLGAVAAGRTPQPEWPLRMTVLPFALLGAYALYKAVARSHGRRAGLLGALVLLSMPQWFLLAHQTMTDLPVAAGVAASVGLLLCGVQTDPDELCPAYEIRIGRGRWRVSLYHLVLGAALLVILPQILYLVSRNLSVALAPHFDIRVHGDAFTSGSAGNCGLPGNEPCVRALPLLGNFQPAVQALVWIQALALLLWMSWGERRRQRVLFLAAWLMACLATMTKGPAGLALPAVGALGYIVASRRWRDLSRLELTSGALLFAATVLPWFVAMYARHGQPFTDRLLFHDMFKRAFGHVHDTNRGDDTSFRYYVWQLGYAVFPWTGLSAVGLVRWLRSRSGQAPAARHVEAVLGAWFLVGFAGFALVGTKYHHYVLPVLPPMAMLTGLLLDDLLGTRGAGATAGDAAAPNAAGERALLGAAAVSAALATCLAGRDLAWSAGDRLADIRLMHLFTYNYGRPWPKSLDFSPALWTFTIVATVLMLLLVVPRLRRLAVGGLLVAAAAFTAWGLDIYLVRASPHWGQRELFLAYERERRRAPGPLVAYQMNWKGENFYRGNEVPAFVSSGRKFTDWIDEQKKKGTKRFYFVTEHGRTRSLQSELGQPRFFDALTTETLNNKFLLVRVRFE